MNDSPHSAYRHPLQVMSIADLFSLAGIWVSLIVLGQLAVAGYLATYAEHRWDQPLLMVACSAGAIFLSLDITTYLLLRGRLIFAWLLPSLYLAATALIPAVAVYLLKTLHSL